MGCLGVQFWNKTWMDCPEINGDIDGSIKVVIEPPQSPAQYDASQIFSQSQNTNKTTLKERNDFNW